MENNKFDNLNDQLTKYLSNELSEQELSAMEQPFADHEDQKQFEEMKTDIEKLDDLKYLYGEETNLAWNKLHSRIKRSEEDHEENVQTISIFKKLKTNYSFAFRVAASIIVVLGLSWFAYQTLYNPLNTIETFAHKAEVTLPDGTHVSLNAYTKLSYPKTFADNERKITLNGEAFFDVVRDESKPFIIDAKDAEITVLGTSFNVFARDNVKGVDVTVTTGAVSLASKITKTESIILSVGEAGTIKENKVNKMINTDLNYLSWKTQIIDFRNTPLSEVVNVLNNTYTANIKLESPTIANKVFTSKYDHIELDKILQTLCIAMKLEREDVNGEIILKKSKN